MTHPFCLTEEELEDRLNEMVEVTFSDLTSQFLTLPRGTGFIEFQDFQDAYEVLKKYTDGFRQLTEATVWFALCKDALCLVVLRTILGLSPPEWADLATSETGISVPTNAARSFDTKVRSRRDLFAARLATLSQARVSALVRVAVEALSKPVPGVGSGAVHRLDKFDTHAAPASLVHAANNHVPYAVLLYERYLGRPFASHRDAVSELIGDVMESAIESELAKAGITFRKTMRAERVPEFDQAPDFFVPTEVCPGVIIEAKITGDDGTARDKVARILRLASMRDERLRNKQRTFQLVACIDGRGFGVRRSDMRDMLRATKGKVFTLSTLPQLIANTDLARYLPQAL
ncbi:RNA-binding protein [Frateuria edaphi]|uniref:RNA recognition motif domain-containing protein n=1 Tax=Frateuria edaphi TaxID=2898793 RepID=UPI001E3CA871|nr:RNA-binding protein [Frateuria edaphi]UGB46593.1 RNA-binding protein [Frateuria edaphi]